MADQDKLTSLTIPFTAGLDTRTQVEALDPTRGLVQATNVRMDKRGSLTKRAGFTALADNTPMLGHHLFAWKAGGPAQVATGPEGYIVRTRSPLEPGRWETTSSTRVSEVMASRYAVAAIRDTASVAAGSNVGAIDACPFGDGWILASSVESDQATLNTCDLIVSAGPTVVDRRLVNNVMDARLVKTGAAGAREAVLVYRRFPDHLICFRTVTWGTDLVVGAESVVISPVLPNLDVTQWWDACECNGNVLVAAKQDATTYIAKEMTPAAAPIDVWTETVANLKGVGVGAYASGAIRSRFVLTYATSGVHSLRRRLAAGGTPTSVTVLNSATDPFSMFVLGTGASDAEVFINSGTDALVAMSVVAMVTTAPLKVLRSHYASSRPVKRNGSTYAMLGLHFNERSVFLAEIFRPSEPVLNTLTVRPVASVAPRLAGNADWRMPNLIQGATTLTAPIMVGESSISSSLQFGVFDFDRRWQSASIGSCQFMGGGVVEQFDGAEVHEAAFLHRPSASGNLTGSGNISVTAGPYRWVVIWEHTDNQGNLHQSAPSSPMVVTSATNKQFTVSIRPLNLTQRQGAGTPVKAVLYRTVSGGSVFYRVGVAVNAPSMLTIVDNVADGNLVSRPMLYKQPGELGAGVDHSAPPGLYPVCTHQGRFVGTSDDGVTLWGSNQVLQGEGLYWSELFTQLAPEGGPITGLASQDGILYVFKRDAIFAMSGEGPTENGVGPWTLQRIPSDVGCVEPRSVVVTTDGVWFCSVRGLELLARGGSVSWAGEPVEELLNLDAYTIVSAVSTQHLVTWSLQSSDHTSGISLVYDQSARAWFKDEVGYGGVASSAAVSAAYCSPDVDGKYTYCRLQVDGRVLAYGGLKDPTTVNGGWITATIETGWVRFAGMVGEQDLPNVYVLSRYDAPHGVNLLASHDYRPFPLPETPRAYTSSEIVSIKGTRESYRLNLVLGNDKRGTAVRLRMTDAPPLGWDGVDSRSASFVGLVFEGTTRASHARHATKER